VQLRTSYERNITSYERNITSYERNITSYERSMFPLKESCRLHEHKMGYCPTC